MIHTVHLAYCLQLCEHLRFGCTVNSTIKPCMADNRLSVIMICIYEITQFSSSTECLRLLAASPAAAAFPRLPLCWRWLRWARSRRGSDRVRLRRSRKSSSELDDEAEESVDVSSVSGTLSATSSLGCRCFERLLCLCFFFFFFLL